MLIKGERGVALVLALAVIALLVSMVVDFSYTMMVDLTLAANLRDSQKAFYAARSGVELAKHLLQKDQKENPDYVGLDEDWAQLPEHPGFLSEDDEGRFKVTIEDESAKIAINKLVTVDKNKKKVVDSVVRAQLEGLFGILELDPQLLDPIINWLDADYNSDASKADEVFYQSQSPPYHCKNGPLDSLDELLLVRGMTKEILYGTEGKKGLIHFLTLYSDGKININTASVEVIQSLSPNIVQNQAQAIVNYLKEKPLIGKESAEWDNVIRPLVEGSADISSDLQNQCVIKSSYFSLRVEGHVRDIKKVIYTVVKREDKKGVQSIFWRVE